MSQAINCPYSSPPNTIELLNIVKQLIAVLAGLIILTTSIYYPSFTVAIEPSFEETIIKSPASTLR